MTYLFSISIGPVQDFIAAARRTRDLWFGSHLLSEVSKAAARELRAAGADLIFPCPQSDADLTPKTMLTVANKILAIADTDDPKKLCERVEAAATGRLKVAATDAKRRVCGKVEIVEVRMDAQINKFLEFYAAWTPYDEQHHRECRNRVELMAAARKATRNFDRFEGAAGVPKSSLDGMRESVLKSGSRTPWTYESTLRTDEALDAIAVVKRFAEQLPHRFESTVDVAAHPLVQKVKQRTAAWRKYLEFVQIHAGYECYALLYEHESRQLAKTTPDHDQTLKELRKNLGIVRPNPPYYALLIGDGDHMGALIERIETKQNHQKVTKSLALFAEDAARVVKDADGCLVYAGGDDVMALLPLDTALDCADKLRKAFTDNLAGIGEPAPTFSAGIAVAHALDPLAETRELAHRAERMAKNEGGRDALAVILAPRSGAEVAATGKWDTFLPALDQTATLYVNKELSPGFAYELRALLDSTPEELDPLLGKMAVVVAGKKEMKAQARALVNDGMGRTQVDKLTNMLLVARPFARARKEAQG